MMRKEQPSELQRSPRWRVVTEPRRGSILLLAVFFMILLSLLAVAFMRLVPAELQAASRHQRDTAAYYTADAGVIDTLAFLTTLTEDGTIDSPTFDGGPIERTGTLGDWEWTCVVTPDAFTYGSGGVSQSSRRAYHLECTSKLRGQEFRKVSVWTVQQPFTPAYGVDQMPGDIWLNLTTFRLEHDYVTNDRLLLYNTDLNWQVGDADMQPSFEGKLEFGVSTPHSTLGQVDGARYSDWSNLPYDDVGNGIDGRYERIARSGANALQHTVAPFDMPETSEQMEKDALGEAVTGPLPIATSIFGAAPSGQSNVNLHVKSGATDLDNGIYIEGSVDRIDFRVDGGELVNVLTGTSSNWNSSHASWSAGEGMTQPEGHLVQNGNQVAEIRQGSGRVDVVFVQNDPITLPVGAWVVDENGNRTQLTSPRTLNPSDNGGEGYTVFRDSRPGDGQLTYSGTLPIVALGSGSLNTPTTSRAERNTYRIMNKKSNGLIYASGNVDGVRGIVSGRRTVATDSAGNQEIKINGHLTLADTPPWSQHDTENDPDPDATWAVPGYSGMKGRDGHPYKDRPAETLSQVGLIGYAVRVKGAQASGANQSNMWPVRSATSEDNPLYLYCSIFAGRKNDPNVTDMAFGGGFGVENSASTDAGLGVGRMEVFGSIVEGTRQRKGTIGQAGYNYSYFYDRSLLTTPPPFFPSSAAYGVVSWEEKSSFNY